MGGSGDVFSTLKTGVECWFPLSSFVLLVAASMPKVVSMAVSKVRFSLASKDFWIAPLLSPQTS